MEINTNNAPLLSGVMGAILPAIMNVTSHDVARLAGVSQSTVSRALRGDPLVAEATRKRIINAVEALRYIPSEAGRSLVTRKTRRVGVVVNDLVNPFYPNLVAPLHNALKASGYRMMVLAERSDQEEIGAFADGSVDGFVLLTSEIDAALPRELARRAVPFVYLNREAESVAADASVVDNHLGAELAAKCLLDLGHRKIAGIFGPKNTSTGRDRELSFRQTLAKYDVLIPEDWCKNGPFSYATGFDGMRTILSRRTQPTAVFCGNDVIAIGALNAAFNGGAAVPGDFSIVGFDDIPMAAWDLFRLTTIGHDLQGMANEAVKLLVDRIEGDLDAEPARRQIATPRLVVRNTVGAPASCPVHNIAGSL